MDIIITRKKIICFLLTILVSYTVLFPADSVNIKELLLLITLFFGFFGNKTKLKVPNYILLLGLLYPILTIIYSLIRNVEISSALSYGYVWLFLLLVPIINDKKFDYLKVFVVSSYVIAIIIDLIFLLDYFNVFTIFDNPISVFFQNMNEIQGLGKGVLATFGYSIFYKSCPLLLLTYSFLLYKKKFLKCIPVLLALFVCGTRANFIGAILITALIPIFCFSSIKKKILVSVVIILLAVTFIPSAYNMITKLNSIKYDRSEAIKISDTKISLEIVNDNVINLMFGTGVGSSFYSSRGESMYTFEFSFIDYLRQTGIFGISIFSFFIYLLIRKIINRKEKWLLVGFICYLAVAFTNPLMVTSTSFMVYLLALRCDFENTKEGDLLEYEKGIC